MPINLETLRVLVVDDERAIADTLALIVSSRGGFVARAVYNGEDAAVLAEEFQPDILISDVMMPGMNGIELATFFASRHPNCKVMLISGNVATADLLAGSARAGHSFSILPKPVHPTTILEFLAACAPVA